MEYVTFNQKVSLSLPLTPTHTHIVQHVYKLCHSTPNTANRSTARVYIDTTLPPRCPLPSTLSPLWMVAPRANRYVSAKLYFPLILAGRAFDCTHARALAGTYML